MTNLIASTSNNRGTLKWRESLRVKNPNVLTVAPDGTGDYLTVAAALAAAAGPLLGYKGVSLDPSQNADADMIAVVTAADAAHAYFVITTYGLATLAKTYEITMGTGVTIAGAVEVDCFSVDGWTAFAMAISAVINDGPQGDLLQADIGQVFRLGVATGVGRLGTCTYFDVDVSGCSTLLELTYPVYLRESADEVEVRLIPGTHTITEPLSVPHDVTLRGEGESLSKIAGTLTGEYYWLRADSGAIVSDVEVGCTPASINPHNAYCETSDVTIERCRFTADNFAIRPRRYGTTIAGMTHLVVQDNYFDQPNPIFMDCPFRQCTITRNAMPYVGTASACLAPMDVTNTETDASMNLSYDNEVSYNLARIEATTNAGSPYWLHYSGSGLRYVHNTIEIVGARVMNAAGVDIRSGVNTWSGATMTDNIVAHNTFIMPSGTTVQNWTVNHGTKWANNAFVVPAGLAAWTLTPVGTDETAIVLTIQPGGLGALKHVPMTLTPTAASVVWNDGRPRVSVNNVNDATPTDAELDTAFGLPATLGEGFIGLVNDADGGVNNYICWVSDGKWVFLKGTVAT